MKQRFSAVAECKHRFPAACKAEGNVVGLGLGQVFDLKADFGFDCVEYALKHGRFAIGGDQRIGCEILPLGVGTSIGKSRAFCRQAPRVAHASGCGNVGAVADKIVDPKTGRQGNKARLNARKHADNKARKALCRQLERAVIDIVEENGGFFAVKVKFDAEIVGFVFDGNGNFRAADAEKAVFRGNFKRDGFFFIIA